MYHRVKLSKDSGVMKPKPSRRQSFALSLKVLANDDGHIIANTNVSLFARAGNICWGHKIEGGKGSEGEGRGGGGGGIDHVSRKIKQPFHNLHEKKYNIGISRFTENKRERFGKSRFTATMEITIHEEKKEPFHISR